jgi:hypothetical protein
MRRYHLVLANGSERDVNASDLVVQDGALVFTNPNREILVVYAPDTWVAAEVERLDDKS